MSLWLMLLFGILCVCCSRSDDEQPIVPEEITPEDTTPEVPSPPADTLIMPYVTADTVYAEYPLLKNLNFVYPSRNPFGQPVMLSGTITMSRSMTKETTAQGIILYNHYTVCRADECPTRGKLDMQNILYLAAPNRQFITVSADYYGFGATESEQQAYCMASANARASIDALIAARQLLEEEGYTWGDVLLNVGYSQGGQTAIAVLRMATEEYPELRFTRTFAGGGPYDLGTTYKQYLEAGSAKLPSAVVNILLAYNTYARLHIPLENMFQGATLEHLDDWWLSKQYSSTEIDRRIGTNDIAQFIAPPLCDLDADAARLMMQAMERENLCRGWAPRKDEDIFLLHHEADDISPVFNTQNLYAFLTQQGVDDVELKVGHFFTLGISQHVSGASAFLTLVAHWIRDKYPVR